MLRSIAFVALCLFASVQVQAYHEGAPKSACRDLTPQHGAPVQTIKPPYTISGPSHIRRDQTLALTLEGDDFLGFIIQARDGQNRPVGRFEISDAVHSQTLDCSAPQDTLTHLNAKKDSPLQTLQFKWIPPSTYTGNVKFMATVVQTGFVYWVGRVTKDVDVE